MTDNELNAQEFAQEYTLLHEEREKVYNEGDSEKGLEIDMQLVSLGLDLAFSVLEKNEIEDEEKKTINDDLVVAPDKKDDLGDFLDYISEHGLGECIADWNAPYFLNNEGKVLFEEASNSIGKFREYINKVAEANKYDWDEEDFMD